MEQDIINYIKEARAHGLQEQEIKQNLLTAGWEAKDVEDNFTHLKAQEHKPAANADEEISLNRETAQKPQALPAQPSPLPQTNVLPAEPAGPSAPFFKRRAFWVSLIGLLVIAGGAGATYFFWYASPERVWKKFTQLTEEKILSSDFKFSYQDKGKLTEDDLVGFPLNDIKLEISGSGYTDGSDENNLQASSDFSYSFASGNTSFSTGFKYKLVGKKFYMNVGDNPFLETIFTQMGNGKKIEWLVLDLDEMEKKSGEQGSEDAAKFQEIFNPEFVKELERIWEDAVFVKMDKYLGREKIAGRQTFHFSNSLDKQAIKNTFNAAIEKIITGIRQAGGEVTDEDVKSAKIAANAIIDKLEVKEFETWIGFSDFKLYKVKVKTSAPSVISVIKTLMEQPQASSRDSKRLADIRQMASALELYYNDEGKYPTSASGIPQDLTPAYIGILPQSPVPADGSCTDYYNTYWYEQKNSGSSYELTFCLGNPIGGYLAGIGRLTPMGISIPIDCPSTEENCYKSPASNELSSEPEKSEEEKVKETVDKIDFSAEVQIEFNNNDYGVKKQVVEPEGAFDLFELIEQQSNPYPIM